MKRKLYKEALIALLVIFIFDLLRLFYVLTNDITSFYDFAWVLLLMIILFLNYQSKREDKLFHIICIITNFLPFLFTILTIIQIVSTGMTFEFNNYFIIYETIFVTAIAGQYLFEFYKAQKDSTNE